MGSFLAALLGLSSLIAAEAAVHDIVREEATRAVEPSSSTARGSEGATEAETDDGLPDLSSIRWARSYGYQCQPFRGRTVCNGPRRVPEPFGPAAELAARLELGQRPTASSLMIEVPRPEWIEAVEGEPPEHLRWPIDGGELSRGFGYVRSGNRRRLHKGYDINADEGTPIRAVADGLVAYSDNGMRGYGNLLMVIHADGTVACYAHCSATFVFAGQQVRAGQVIGAVGHTGNAMGPHLHFELRSEGRPTDPYTFFENVYCHWPRFCQALERYHRRAQ